MKNFVKHILAIAICAAALLSSCIKEENFKRDTVQLNVTLTRSSADSTQPGTGLEQGDKIEDVTLWAFSYTEVSNGFPVIADGATAVGYRYVNGITDTYGSIGIHVPLPTCNNTANYLIVAVINRSAFGSDFSLGQTSDWQTIREANFSANAKFWDVHPQDATPELMPVSNWAAFTINSGNVHEQNDGTWKCYNLQLPVYRAVAKSQLYMAKTSENFILVVKEAKVVAKSGYSDGKVLTYTSVNDTTKSEVKGLPSASDSDWWWTKPSTVNSVSYVMRNTAVENSQSTWNEVTVTQTGSAENPQNNTFQWVGSTFLLENDNEADYGTTGAHEEAQGEGYNLYVKYTVDDQEYEVYTPLGKVVRNHDYQVKATVDAGGEITLNIEVVDWIEENINMTYENTVTIDPNGYLKWTQLPKTTITSDTGITYTEQVIDMTESAGQMAVCTFALQTPQYGTWHAELLTIEGVSGAIAFFDQDGNNLGTSTSGPISWLEGDEIPEGKVVGDPRPGKLIIKTVKGNYTGEGSLGRNLVELRIYATGPAGVYQIPNLPGVFNTNGTIKFSYYQLLQPRM